MNLKYLSLFAVIFCEPVKSLISSILNPFSKVLIKLFEVQYAIGVPGILSKFD